MLEIPKNELDLPLKILKMYESEYKDLVLADFDRQKNTKLLPSELLSPTPGGLKSLSVNICESRFDPKDGIILESFFNRRADGVAYALAIQNAQADPFRPLNTFLRDRSINTTLRNINLLAWLIDFKPRPFHPDLIIPVKPETDKSPVKPPGPGGKPQPSVPPPIGINKKKVLLTVLLLLIISSVSYYLFQKKSPYMTGKEGCMIWDDDHYQPIDCKDTTANSLCYPIDHQLVANFKRITKPDTLTPRSIKKVWYAKYNGQVYFFTADGPFPLDTNRRLLVMSAHILDTHVYHIKN